MDCAFCLQPLVTWYAPSARECRNCGLLYTDELLATLEIDQYQRAIHGEDPSVRVERTPGTPPTVTFYSRG